MVYRLLKCWICCAVVFHVLIFSYGCRDPQEEKLAPIKSFLSDYLKNQPNWPEDAKERTRITLAKCENKTLGLEPVLLIAGITRAEVNEGPDMVMVIVDQNEDVIGVGIREDCRDSNCCWKTIEETYPVYFHNIHVGKTDGVIIPLHIRDNCQKKDESAWNEYLNLDYYKLHGDYIRQNLSKHSIQFGSKCIYSVSDASAAFWESTLPPVWVSKPEPHKLDVWVWVFDKAGNKSEPVKLINLSDLKRSEEPNES